MTALKTFLDGKKTYITAAVAGAFAVAQALGYPIPEFVYVLLGAAGITTLRVAVDKA